MREMWVIAKREFNERVRSKWFLVMTILWPILMAGMLVVPALIGGQGTEGAKVVIIDKSGELAKPMAFNLGTLLKIAVTNVPLVRYLVQQGTQSMAGRMKVMRIFYPNAQAKDWKLVDGGIRVQAIKKTDGEAGIVHFGTEVLTSADKSMSALLGASPGASVCVNIVMEVIKNSFPHLTEGEAGKKRIEAIIPTYGTDYRKPELAGRFNALATDARKQLKLI